MLVGYNAKDSKMLYIAQHLFSQKFFSHDHMLQQLHFWM